MKRRLAGGVLTLALALALACAGAAAQSFPAKPVRIVVTLAAGPAGDILSRVLGENSDCDFHFEPRAFNLRLSAFTKGLGINGHCR